MGSGRMTRLQVKSNVLVVVLYFMLGSMQLTANQLHTGTQHRLENSTIYQRKIKLLIQTSDFEVNAPKISVIFCHL